MGAVGNNILPFRRGGHAPSDGVPMGRDPAVDLAAELRLVVSRAQMGETRPPDEVARELLSGMARRGWVLLLASDL